MMSSRVQQVLNLNHHWWRKGICWRKSLDNEHFRMLVQYQTSSNWRSAVDSVAGRAEICIYNQIGGPDAVSVQLPQNHLERSKHRTRHLGMGHHELLISSRVASCLWSLHKLQGLVVVLCRAIVSFSKEMFYDSLRSSAVSTISQESRTIELLKQRVLNF